MSTSKLLANTRMLDMHNAFTALMLTAFELKDNNPEETKIAKARLQSIEQGIAEIEEDCLLNERAESQFNYKIDTIKLQQYITMIKQGQYDTAISSLTKECEEWNQKYPARFY